MKMHHIIKRFPDILYIHGNLFVFGKTEDEHVCILLNLTKVASKKGFILIVESARSSLPKAAFTG